MEFLYYDGKKIIKKLFPKDFPINQLKGKITCKFQASESGKWIPIFIEGWK